MQELKVCFCYTATTLMPTYKLCLNSYDMYILKLLYFIYVAICTQFLYITEYD